MTRLQFHNLLKRYLDNNSTPEEISLINTWYELIENENLKELSANEIDEIEGRLWHKIQGKTIYKSEVSTDNKAIVVRFNWKKYVAAASIVFVIASAIGYYLSSGFSNKTLADLIPTQGFKVVHNTTQNNIKLSLNDGTTVELKPNATLHYPVLFVGDRREVYAEGDVFFDVVKNPSKPFYVYENNLVTQVIGTSFWVKENTKDKQLDVEVVTGKVEVYENEKLVKLNPQKSNGVIITPNQKVTYSQNQQKFETTIVTKPVLVTNVTLTDLKNKLMFDEAPITNVISLLQKMYGIEIIVENEKINNCPFTGDISELDMFKQLDLLCKSIGKSYEIKGTKILIKGNGCK